MVCIPNSLDMLLRWLMEISVKIQRAAMIVVASAVTAGAALIVTVGTPAPPIVAGVSPLGRVVIIANL